MQLKGLSHSLTAEMRFDRKSVRPFIPLPAVARHARSACMPATSSGLLTFCLLFGLFLDDESRVLSSQQQERQPVEDHD